MSTHSDSLAIIVVHEDFLLRQRLVKQISEWCDASIWVVGVGERKFRTYITPEELAMKHESGGDQKSKKIIAVLHSSNLNRWSHRKYRRLLKKAGQLETKFAPLPDRGDLKRYPAESENVFRDERAARKFQQVVEGLFRDWNPDDAEVTLTGANGPKARYLQRFMFLHGIPYRWVTDEIPETRACLRDGTEFPATVGELYTRLILGKPPYDPERRYDLVIVGAGPAGLSAGISAGAVGLSALVIEPNRPGGSAAMSINRIENYLGFPGGVTGTKLAKLAVKQLQDVKVDLCPTITAREIQKDKENDSRYIVVGVTADGEVVRLSTGMILIACGQKPGTLRHPDTSEDLEIPQDVEIGYDMEPHVANDAQGKSILIVGGGDTAGQAALLYLEHNCASVRLVTYDYPDMGGALYEKLEKKIKIDYKSTAVGFNHEDDGRIRTTIRSLGDRKKEHSHLADRVHVLIGGRPNTDWLEISPVKVDMEDGFILTDVHTKDFRQAEAGASHGERLVLPHPFHTSQKGIFAVGDVRRLTRRRVGQAVGQGAAAVGSMEKYLLSKDERNGGYVWQRVLSSDPPSLWRRWREAISEAESKSCSGTSEEA
ncbi:NAD(P)/FAD-dependent oxidoreductase [Streptomyces sp. NBC_00568]|uniref:NAD(P)/FAD-dependent oxidoreductase n=1 Tax=Streptomyces sp. NBC_00568 TaxID=2975779 RepID=UPI002253040A|nr:NAD(P)/FAD-dependent oxidoreductase [Streptomyces sp. NBC_00568]MCX4993766.1 NAD(P)/FAD-dependent oxidoreductase [Streptomyces sp. NBC_00568]